MAEEVKIVDVAGGPAAEATLQELLKVMKGKGGGGGSGGGSESSTKAQDLYTTAVTRGTKTRQKNTKAVENATSVTEKFSNTVGSLVGGIGSALGGLIGITKNFADAMTTATTIGGVLEAVPIFGSVLSSATGYFQNSIDTFRTLSDVGAGFGNDMMAMRNSSAEAGLSLEQFAAVISSNATRMNLLGATTSQGADRMGKISKAMRTQEAGLLRLGLTQEDVNEGLMDYIENQALQGRMNGRSNASLAAGAASYLKELDLLARATGRSRREIQDEMNSRARSANVNVMLANMDPSNVDAFQRNLQFASDIMGQSGPAFSDALADMADGVSQTPLAKYLEANVHGLKELQMQNERGEITEAEYQQRLQELTPQISNLFDGMGSARVQAIMAREGLGELANMTADARVAGQRGIDIQNGLNAAQAAAAEQARRAPLTNTFANFEQTIQNVRSAFEDALIDSGILDTVGGLLGDLGTGLTSLAQDGVAWLSDYLQSDSFQKALTGFKDWIELAKNKVKNFVTDIGDVGIGQAIKNLFAGEDGSGIDIGGMFGDFLGSAFSSMLPSLDTVLVGLAAGIATLVFAPVAAPFLAVGAALAAMFGYSTIKGWISDGWDALTGVFTSIGEWFSTSKIREKLAEAWSSVTGVFTGIGEWFSNTTIGEILTNAWNSVTGVFTGIGEWWSNFNFGEFVDNTLVTIWDKAAAAFNFIGEWFSDFSLSETLTNMWNTVTGFFSFGDGESSFSISQLVSDAWSTVTGFFSFGDMELPSISSLFQGIIDRVKGFFSFDFELPNFRDFLPTWLGGEGRSLDGGSEPGTTATSAVTNPEQTMPTIEQPTNVTALGGLNFASQVEGARELQTVLADISAMQSFNTELERIQSGLDSSAVDSYNTSMEKLVETLEALNDVLAEDNKGMLGGGTGVSAASMLSSGQLGGGSGTGSEEQMNRLNMLVAQLVSLTEESNRYTRGTMRAVNGNLQVGV